MITEKKVANAFGGKTARACDCCLRKRARWYCPADDAFLCQACDSSVHSVNRLASRHERVRLETATHRKAIGSTFEPAWHQGFTRKARTPRHAKPELQPPKDEREEGIMTNPLALVPEINSEEESPNHENEDQLLYRVPICDPFLCDVSNEGENNFSARVTNEEYDQLDNIHGFDLPSDMDLAEFAADVEHLFGQGIDEDHPCGIEDLGFLDNCKGGGGGGENIAILDDCLEGGKLVKVENEMIDWDFDYGSPVVGDEEKAVTVVDRMVVTGGDCKEEVERKRFLRLDYEAVIAAWACQGCPWTTGRRPEFNPNDCWPDFVGSYPSGSRHECVGGVGGQLFMRCGDGGREARVTRYREKRRTRLFSKKIRYEVRKLNAEKRPRMKGRFVKRPTVPSFATPPPPVPGYHLHHHHMLNN